MEAQIQSSYKIFIPFVTSCVLPGLYLYVERRNKSGPLQAYTEKGS